MTPSTDIGAKVKRCAVCKIDFKGRFVYVDDAVEQLLGHSREELFGKSFLDFVEADEQPTVAHVLYQRNHFETFFESVRLALVDRSGQPIPARILISLNFIAGSPVNFQIIIDVENFARLAPTSHSHDISFQDFATDLATVDPTGYCESAITLLHRFSGVRRSLLYRLRDNRIELVRSHNERIASLADIDSYEPLLQWVAGSGDEYFFLDPQAVQHAIEKTLLAPNELITTFNLKPSHRYLLRVAFEDGPDPSMIQATVDDLRQAIGLAQRMAPAVDDEPAEAIPDLSARQIVDLLSRTGVHYCLTGFDGSIRTLDAQWHTYLNTKDPIERYRDILVALAEFNNPEVMQRIVDSVCIPFDTGRESRFDEVISIVGGRRARLIVTRLTQTVQDESACLVLIPLSRDDTARYDGSIDNGALHNILLELQSNVVAAASVSERLAHEYYDDLGRNGNHYLATLGEKNRKLNGMLSSLLLSLQIVDEEEPTQTTDLNLLVNNLAMELRSSFPGMAFELKCMDLPKIQVKPRKLATAVRNILVNSLKYSRPGGVEVVVQAVVAKESCSISVSDNGPGISGRFLSQVSEFYYRAPDPHTQAVDGLGCGLAIVRQIMKSLGGRMNVVSEMGKGTTVTLMFPVTSVEKSQS